MIVLKLYLDIFLSDLYSVSCVSGSVFFWLCAFYRSDELSLLSANVSSLFLTDIVLMHHCPRSKGRESYTSANIIV